jgi:predicted nucleic acid-binding protein
VGRINNPESKLVAIVDSNILVYALIKNYPDKERHERCLTLLNKGLKGQLNYFLAVNPIIIAEVFTVLRKILSCNEAEARISTLLNSRHIIYLSISKEACQTAVEWTKEYNIPVNDALIAASAKEHAPTIYTTDEHFKKLEAYNITIINPTVATV